MGSKRRIAKDILPIIFEGRKENQIFYDLFVGGGNLLDKVQNPRVANDNNKYLSGRMCSNERHYYVVI